jgi:outer membrane protein
LKSGALLFLLLFPFAAAAQVPAPAAPASPVTLTLQEALHRALTENPALGRTRSEVSALQAQERVIFSSILPKINLQGNLTRNDQEVAFGSGEDARTILPENDWSYRLVLSQPVYAGNRERKAIKQARLGIESARQGLSDAEDQVIASVVANYLAVLEAESLLAVEQKNVDLARRRRDQAQIFFEAGESTRVDVLRAEADIKGAERRLAAARQDREAAVGRLRLDLALDAPLQVTDPGDVFPPLPPESELLETAVQNRPEVLQTRTAQEIARLEIAKQKGAYLPLVTADGAWINQRSAFPSDQYGQLSLRVSVPIFSSGEIKGRVITAQERERQAGFQVQQAEQAVREEVRQALVGLQTTAASLQLAREQLAAAEAEYAQANELYRAQELTSLEAEAAETSLADARRAVATSELDRNLAELQVWAAAGLLKKTFSPGGVQ